MVSESPPAGIPVAAIDIGTNSIHLVVARPTGNNRFEILARDKEVVRLGSGSGEMKELHADAIERGVAALGRFRRVADSFGAEVHAVATSAVREAENREKFLEAALAKANVGVDVISGVEEARLIHLGVLQAVPVYDKQVLVVDIGGGSTELIVGRGGDVLAARSVKVGAIRVTDRFFRKEPVKKKAVEQARKDVKSFIAPRVQPMVEDAGGFEFAVGSSGTILSVAEMIRARRGGEPDRQVGLATFTADGLAEVVEDLASRPRAADRLGVPGLDPRRADIILGGVIVLEQVFRSLGIAEMVTSDYALREGVLLDVVRRRAGTVGHLGDLRYESVRHLAALVPGEEEHCGRIAALALQLFEGTRHLSGLSQEAEEWLEAAALLQNVGLVISHDRHHLHSYYVIRNSELLTGFTDHEIELIALVARYHRKSAPRARHPEYARLHEADRRVVEMLSGMLRIAAGLDRTRCGAVRRLRVDGGHDGQPLRILVETASGLDADLELYSADNRKGLLEEALGVPIQIQSVPPGMLRTAPTKAAG